MITSFNNYITENFIPNKDYFPSKTSVKQVALGLKYMIEMGYSKSSDVNLDYGGGRFELGTEYMKEHGVTNLVYDLYSRSMEHNTKIIDKLLDKEPDTVTLLNVLNVIHSKSERLYVIKDAYDYLKVGGYMLIMVYMGTGSEPGLSKSKTWQENRNMESYLPEIQEAIPNLNHQIIKMTSRMLLLRKTNNTNEGIKDYLKPKTKEDIVYSLLNTDNPQKSLEYLYKNFDVKQYKDVVENLMKRINSNWIKAFINSKSFKVKISTYHVYLYGCGLCDELTPLKIVNDRKMAYSGGIYSLHKCEKCGQYVIVNDQQKNFYSKINKIEENITENIRTKKGSLIKRFGNVGKKMGDDLYFHKDYVLEYIGDYFYNKVKSILPKGFNFNIIKYNEKYGSISFIDSPDFDIADEPIVGDSYKITTDGKITFTRRKSVPQIYHHKWLFVKDDYKGFDVEQSKERSKKWLEYSDIINMSKIGYQNYWNDEVLPLIK